MTQFRNQTVLISGAAGGFGSAAASLFFDAGANLVLTDLQADALERNCPVDPDRIALLAGDVSDEALSASLVELALSRFGRLDVAVNNAGVAHLPKPLPTIESAEAQNVIQTDLLGVFFAMKHQLPPMARTFAETGRTGTIINIASAAGVVGAAGLSVYAAAKHGVVGLTRSAAIEYARRGVRVNALCPSFARTAMVSDVVAATAEGNPKSEEKLVRGIPMARIAEVDEVMKGLLFLADQENSFMTGQTLQLDGGLTAY